VVVEEENGGSTEGKKEKERRKRKPARREEAGRQEVYVRPLLRPVQDATSQQDAKTILSQDEGEKRKSGRRRRARAESSTRSLTVH
jgi:hypothetical protein